MKIALAGNPNCGKTTLFNCLTGNAQHVGNWPGVTVEKKEGALKNNKDIQVVDLPGIYSLSPYTLEEVVARDYLRKERPDVILNIVDASNLERNLYLSTQLMELDLPMVIALNMMDVVTKRGDTIQCEKIKEALGCPVVEISALKNQGIAEAIEQAKQVAKKNKKTHNIMFQPEIEGALSSISVTLDKLVSEEEKRWFSIKLFERDEKTTELFKDKRNDLEETIQDVEKKLDSDSESLIANGRYAFITDLAQQCLHKNQHVKKSVSDKLDEILTNRFLALPIFAAVMWLVYTVSISTIGGYGTDWVNDVFVGEILQPGALQLLESMQVAPWLTGLAVDGIIAGLGAVLGFLPQMLVLFFFLAILEDCGYMARIAFIMDRIFRHFGLSGKSFIPILIGTGCGVPGIMASRTIENEKDRKITIMTTTFIPCSAKIPIIALMAGALFPDANWVGPSAYFLGIGAILFSGIFLKKLKLFRGAASPFVMELPPYHLPGLKTVGMHMLENGKAFIKKAGTIIFVACTLIWFMQSFNWRFEMVDTDQSILASVGNVIAPLFAPLGWGSWQAAVATISGFVAKENIVGTFGIVYGFAEVAEDGVEVWATLQSSFTQVAAYSFLAFNLLCAPCFAAIGAIHREMGDSKWTIFAVAYQMLFAYTVALIINVIGSALCYGQNQTAAVVLGICSIAGVIYVLFRGKRQEKKWVPSQEAA